SGASITSATGKEGTTSANSTTSATSTTSTTSTASTTSTTSGASITSVWLKRIAFECLNRISPLAMFWRRDWNQCSVAELKDVLRANGKPISGKKCSLVERCEQLAQFFSVPDPRTREPLPLSQVEPQLPRTTEGQPGPVLPEPKRSRFNDSPSTTAGTPQNERPSDAATELDSESTSATFTEFDRRINSDSDEDGLLAAVVDPKSGGHGEQVLLAVEPPDDDSEEERLAKAALQKQLLKDAPQATAQGCSTGSLDVRKPSKLDTMTHLATMFTDCADADVRAQIAKTSRYPRVKWNRFMEHAQLADLKQVVDALSMLCDVFYVGLARVPRVRWAGMANRSHCFAYEFMWPIASGSSTLMRFLERQLIKFARDCPSTGHKLRNRSDGGEVMFECKTCFLYITGTVHKTFNARDAEPDADDIF
ncbi:MAG: SAP domain-containing protein, partial [Pseudomonadales bacterium]|nr:SAP domain-containing protein [Pseudomonadales bacterium]